MARPTTHGMAHTRTYKSWGMMKERCNNSAADNYADYGGRGISYDPAWEFFENFLLDMGQRPDDMSLDRLDTDGHYCKANCKWSTASEQQQNKRKFKQPAGRTYGLAACSDCAIEFTKRSPLAKRCPTCLAHARRYHAG